MIQRNGYICSFGEETRGDLMEEEETGEPSPVFKILVNPMRHQGSSSIQNQPLNS